MLVCAPLRSIRPNHQVMNNCGGCEVVGLQTRMREIVRA